MTNIIKKVKVNRHRQQKYLITRNIRIKSLAITLNKKSYQQGYLQIYRIIEWQKGRQDINDMPPVL